MVSVNVAEPRPLATARGVVPSAIGKEPVGGARWIGALNVEGDRQADLRVHGGPDQAVYCYPVEHYAAWAADLGREPGPPGWFGENLTLRGLDETTVRVGDVLAVGTARLVVTRPRTPCFKLAASMGVRGFERMFQRSGRSGWYARVLAEGQVAAGDAVERLAAGAGPTVLAALRARDG